MRLIRPALIAAAALAIATACAQTPTSAKAAGTTRMDGGNSLGSGSSVPTDSTQRGGNSLGSGN